MPNTEIRERVNQLFIIGIDKYINDKYSELNNSVNDCENIKEELINNYKFNLIENPLYNESATRSNITDALYRLQISTLPEDNLVIYYAGHGNINNNTNKGAWIPYDASEFASDYIPHILIKDIIEDIQAKHIFLISDSCFSGTFLTNFRSAAEDIKAYTNLDARKSRWYLASGGNEKVTDGPKGKGSPFSNRLLDYLKQETQYKSVSDIINYVIKLPKTIAKQNPVGGEIHIPDHELGQMVFIRSLNTKAQILKGQITLNQLDNIARAYGHFKGITEILKSGFNKYVDLKVAILFAITEWELTFESSIVNFEGIIKKVLHKNPEKPPITKMPSIFEETIKETSAKQFATSDKIERTVEYVRKTVRGEIESPAISTLLAYKAEFIQNPVSELMHNFVKEIEMHDVPYTLGLNFTMKIPMSWIIKRRDPKLDSSVNFKGESLIFNTYNASNAVLMSLSIIKNPHWEMIEDSPSQWTTDTVKDMAENDLCFNNLKKMINAKDNTNIDYKKMTISGCYGALLEYENTENNMQASTKSHNLNYFFQHKGFTIIVRSKLNKSEIDIPASRDKYLLLFESVLSTFVITNKSPIS